MTRMKIEVPDFRVRAVRRTWRRRWYTSRKEIP
jgi:hypothetical protein